MLFFIGIPVLAMLLNAYLAHSIVKKYVRFSSKTEFDTLKRGLIAAVLFLVFTAIIFYLMMTVILHGIEC